MKTLKLTQGSPEWLAHRRTHFNASDAAAMMDCSPYKTRNQLLHELKTGLAAEVSAEGQRRFDDGHRFEALARPLAEEFIGEDLYPVVGTEGKLSASYDGLTIARKKNFEHKSLNDELRACFAQIESLAVEVRDIEGGKLLPMYHRVQMEHQHLVCKEAEQTLFMASKWRGEDLVEERHCWYAPDPQLAAQVAAGWEQFEKDLVAYEPAEAVTPIVAAPMVYLPALSIKVEGSIALVDNLLVFGAALQDYVANINLKPETDQDFANLDTVIKTLKRAEDELEAGETHALAQTESISVMRTTVAQYKDLARTNRLLANRLFTTEKANRKLALVTKGGTDCAAFMAELNATFPKPYMPTVPTDFAGVTSGLKSIDSMKNAIESELARAKIAASAIATRITKNLNVLRDKAKDHAFLFHDVSQIVLMENDHLAMLVDKRISDHKAAELIKEEETRERIRAEELARIELEQAAAAKKLIDDAAAATALAATQAAMSDQIVTGVGMTKIVAVLDGADDAPVMLVQHVPAGNVVPMRAAAPAAPAPAAPPATPPTMKLGDINAQLSPIGLTADGLTKLGFPPAATDKSAKLYHARDLTRICGALHDLLDQVQAKQAA